MPDECEANAISFLIPSNNKLHVKSPMETPQCNLGFNRSYSKINNFNLMKTLNLTSITNDKLQDLAHKVPEMKHRPIYRINSTLTKLTAYSTNFWSSLKVKIFSSLSSLTTELGIIALAIVLYFKCFQNKMSCVHKHTRPTTLPNNDSHIELQPITNPPHEIQINYHHNLMKMLKASGLDMSKL